MKPFAALLLGTTLLASACNNSSSSSPSSASKPTATEKAVADLPQAAATDEARLVPTTDDAKGFVGYKVFAIHAGGRFEHAGFQMGDVITAVDNTAVTTDAGRQALDKNVIGGAAKATVTVTRAGQPVTLTVDAK